MFRLGFCFVVCVFELVLIIGCCVPYLWLMGYCLQLVVFVCVVSSLFVGVVGYVLRVFGAL